MVLHHPPHTSNANSASCIYSLETGHMNLLQSRGEAVPRADYGMAMQSSPCAYSMAHKGSWLVHTMSGETPASFCSSTSTPCDSSTDTTPGCPKREAASRAAQSATLRLGELDGCRDGQDGALYVARLPVVRLASEPSFGIMS
eukprot:6193074-Pleurochrysis_carterae.AAC.12